MLDDERAIVEAMYGDAVQVIDDAGFIEFHVSLHDRCRMSIALQRNQYPKTRPFVTMTCHDHHVSTKLTNKLREIVTTLPQNQPILTEIILNAQQLSEEVNSTDRDAPSKDEPLECETTGEVVDAETPDFFLISSHVRIYRGAPIQDRKSKFLAHAAHVASNTDVALVLRELREMPRISAALHPAIYAFRFTDSQGMLHADSDDDGENGASKKIMFLLQHLHAENCLVVVTRWFGGVLLGPDRFKHIAAVTRQVLTDGGFIQQSKV